MKKLYGTGVALVTPFTESLEVDYKALKKLLAHTAKGADYYVVMGTTAEAPTCTAAEKKQILQFVKDNNPKSLPVVYGIGGNNTRDIVESIGETDLRGVAALLSVSPYYNKPSQAGIVQHFRQVADASPVPVMLYNIPGRTGSNMTAETTLQLADHSNIIGIKEASGNLEQCLKIAKYMPKDFLLISGDDMFTIPLYAIGGKGVISVLANAYPALFRKMKAYALASNFPKAVQAQFQLTDVNACMYEEGNPVGIKYVLSKMGIGTDAVRLPMVAASAALRKKIDDLSAHIR